MGSTNNMTMRIKNVGGCRAAPLPRPRLPQPTMLRASEPPRPKRSDGMPSELGDQLDELEHWATSNQSDARRESLRFWALKAPAIVVAAGGGVCAYFHLSVVGLLAGAVASFCVMIDGIHPRGMLRNVHLRALHDIRILTTSMVSKWRSRKSDGNDVDAARQIISEGEDERKRIAVYVRDAETALESTRGH